MNDSYSFHNEGANHTIYKTPNQTIVKISKRNSKTHDCITQRRFHFLAQDILSDTKKYTALRVPILSSSCSIYEHIAESQYATSPEVRNPQHIRASVPNFVYEMKEIDTSKPIYVPSNPILIHELATFWLSMWAHRFALYDFELFEQPDGKVCLLDFDSTGFRMTLPFSDDYIHIPGKKMVNDSAIFFLNPCFPEEFLTHLLRKDPSLKIRGIV